MVIDYYPNWLNTILVQFILLAPVQYTIVQSYTIVWNNSSWN